jgi:type II secretory pathway component PulM
LSACDSWHRATDFATAQKNGRHLPLHSPSADGLSPRDRRALTFGAVAVLCVLLLAAAIPAARRWSDRESMIAARRGELARLKGISANVPMLRNALDARSARAAEFSQRPVSAATAALAAGVLQSVLQRYADESQLSVSELNVAGEPDSTATPLAGLPATLIAIGDVFGVADLLSRVQQGNTLLEVRELTVQVNPARRADGGGELLQVTLVVRAPFVLE